MNIKSSYSLWEFALLCIAASAFSPLFIDGLSLFQNWSLLISAAFILASIAVAIFSRNYDILALMLIAFMVCFLLAVVLSATHTEDHSYHILKQSVFIDVFQFIIPAVWCLVFYISLVDSFPLLKNQNLER